MRAKGGKVAGPGARKEGEHRRGVHFHRIVLAEAVIRHTSIL